RYDHQLRPARELRVRADRRVFEEVGQGMAAGERGESLGADEALGRRGHHHPHLGPGLEEAPGEVGGFVGRHATGDAEDDPAAGEHQSSCFSTVTLPSAISSMAMVSGLRDSEWTCGGTYSPMPPPSWLK